MITTVTLNPAIDITLELNQFILNEYNLVHQVSRIPGGKGINVSKAVRAYGSDTMALGFLGGNTGHLIADKLRDYGIITNFWHIEEETRTNIIIVDHKNQTHTLLSDPGPKICKRDLEHFKSIFSRVMSQSKIVVISGSLPIDVDNDIYYQLIELAHQKKVKALLDASGIVFEKGLEAKPILAKPDLRATGNRVFDKVIDDQETAIKIAHEIINRGVEIAVISYQDTKDIIATKEEVWLAETIDQKVVNIIGTAEAMLAGFAIKLVQEEKEETDKVIRFAMACGLASALTEEEEFHTREDIDRCLPYIKITKLK
ncbi:MAG: 1-phosphofructokinase family hexose kinase [Candidatus Atribacteria bacterium]|nr:1-phosphofructokinase family hexose kinase [Candidatus Atribacteria bacterium]